MNLLTIPDAASQTAAIPTAALQNGPPPDGAQLFALLFEATGQLPAVTLLAAPREAAPILFTPKGMQPDTDLQKPTADDETPLTLALPANLPSEEPKTALGRVVADLQAASRPSAQATGFAANPTDIDVTENANANPLSHTRSAGEESQHRARPVAASAAQSVVEGRIVPLPDVAIEKMEKAQMIRAENASTAVGSVPGFGQKTPPPPAALAALPNEAAQVVSNPQASTYQGQGWQETDATGRPQVSRAEVHAVAPNSPAVGKLPTVAVAHGLKNADVALPEPAPNLIEQDGLQGVISQDRQISVAASTGAAPSVGSETARHAAQQIATAVIQGNGKSTEIALNPEELGRVRLTLTATDGALTMTVLADRPETQELLRRHIDVLAQEFRALGYESVSFSFNAEGQADSGGSTETSEIASHASAQNIESDEVAEPMPSNGLDLRL